MNDYREILNVIGWTLAALSTLFVAARSYTRARVVTTRLGWDDWCMIAGLIFALACTSLVTVGTTHGLGEHVWDIEDPDDQASAAMYVLLAPCFSIASAFFTKASIIISLMRIRGHTARLSHKCIAYTPLAVLLIGSVLSCSVMIFFCSPVQKSWRPQLEGTCLSPAMLDIVGKSVSVYNAIMDIFCAVMPYFVIRSLNIPRKDKRNLVILMGGSIVGTFATVMKIIAMSNISNVADMTHSWSEITIWYLTENNILIIAGSFPALRPFWRIVIGKYSSYLLSNTSRNTPRRGAHGRATESKELQEYNVGSKAVAGETPKLYSMTIQDSSEERLCRQQDGTSLETVEGILINHGDDRFRRQAHIASSRTDGESPSDGMKITVTREVQII